MRPYLVAGNWKQNLGPAAAAKLARQVAMGLLGLDLSGEVLVCPPAVSIPAVAAVVKGERLLLGAQNCSATDAGAYTGEVGADMLAEAGCSHVIVAHSERRAFYGETDDDFVRKIDRAHAAGLTVIFCYGELLGERRAGREREVVRAQLAGVLPRLAAPAPNNLVLAYEPVWAIGTGETATPEQAQAIHAVSRDLVSGMLGAGAADALRILYGGSVKPGNAEDLFGRADIDGGLIGGASLKTDDFLGIVRCAQAVA
ncbi:triose-phosphate isomerase [bacterium]|nr:triose-phosphate isomerase [bacterium]MBU1073233.1 triose-phosphate isomerase [bacterium]MBU1674151.1 triose-phosphate isomerase [bacterium]